MLSAGRFRRRTHHRPCHLRGNPQRGEFHTGNHLSRGEILTPLPDTERCDTDARLLFTDPAFRELCLDWRTNARTCVAHLRLEAANRPGDPGLAALVGELSVADADFRQWWAGRQMTGLRMGTKRLRHPVVGVLTLDRDSLTYAAAPAQKLVIATAAPETPSRDGLLFLASWTADSDQPARDAAA
ncbi:MmyB family transcriptional regulator [Streptomyces sp. NPDC054950]